MSKENGLDIAAASQDWTLRHEPGVWEMLGSVVDALGFCPLAWPRSVLGTLRSRKPAPFSEYELFWQLAVYLTDILVPSLPIRTPGWVLPPFSRLFFHHSGELKPPEGDPPTKHVDGEQWFFINGILTNEDVARMNAAYLVDLFHRPIRILWNSTDGFKLDLLECASEKLGARDADVAMALYPVLDAIADPKKQRVVVIAHSQGTLITAVVLRLIKAVYHRTMMGTRGRLSGGDREAICRHAAAEGLTVQPKLLKPVRPQDLARFEVYCFANCATEMKYIDEDRSLPRIESFGNEHDLVARLGMLAPDPDKRHIEISGPRFIHNGAWGHLLNAHYLIDIDRAQRQRADAVTPNTDPYRLIEGSAPPGTLPRLFDYLNGGGAIS
ncbi:MAG TPA: hypothetical protein VE197_09930 [Mycobacterium sp.]|nr:hypothetical protein [Mycobacterium sp.]